MQEHSTVVVEEQKSMLIENLTVLGSCTITGSFEIRDIRFQSFSTLTVVSETETCLLQNKTSTSVSPNISFNSETLVLLSNIPTNAQTITAEHHEALLAYLQHPEMLKLFNPTADMISGINDYTDEHLMEILSNTLLLAESTPVALCRIIGEYLLTEEVAIAPEFE
ncbi:MAG: hypothetical protein COA94_02880 [Rickettsiales bacterium]|nr:MAG: hypothetical protein COA94_02880 [Rickettsiales bacterium]